MENVYLGRKEAPIGADTWQLIDSTMVEAAKSQLAGRRLLPVEGPYGFGVKVLPLSDCETDEGALASSFIPITVIQSLFSLGKRDIAAFERDKLVFDGSPVSCAAMDCAVKEDRIVFHGIGSTSGLLTSEGASFQSLTKWDKVGTAADQIIEAVTKLDDAGFHGGYCMALAPSLYNLLLRRYPQGDGTELDHIRTIVTEGVIKAPVLEKGGVLLASGRHFSSLCIGQDMAVGYNGPVGDNLEFYVSESLAVLIRVPEAICVLR